MTFAFAALDPALANAQIVQAWGSNMHGETTVPSDLGNCSRISAGEMHAVAITSDGFVRAWGSNFYGQVSVPNNLGTCIKIAAGLSHTVAIKTDGTVRAWGDNWANQTNVPSDLGQCKEIAAGGSFNLAIKTNGTVVGWGDNDSGQTTIPSALGLCTKIAAGTDHSVAIRTDGMVRAWGDNSANQTNVPSTLGACTQIAAGYAHTVAIKADGTVIGWGSDFYGQKTPPANLGSCKRIAAAQFFTVAIKTDGTVVGWGLYDTTNLPTNLGVCTEIAAGGESFGGEFSMAIQFITDNCPNDPNKTEPGICGCGVPDTDTDQDTLPNCNDPDDDDDGIIDSLDGCPLDRFKSAPGICGCGVPDNDTDQDGTADCVDGCPIDPDKTSPGGCGCNIPDDADDDGILDCLVANGPVVQWGYALPTGPPSILGRCSQISSSFRHTNAIRSREITDPLNQTVAAWGDDTSQSGQNSVPSDLGECLQIAAGRYHTVAIRKNLSLQAWGDNTENQSTIPNNLPACFQIAAGSLHTVALVEGGVVRAWGNNFYGQRNVSLDLGPCNQIAAGPFFTVVIRNTGDVQAWGDNTNGQTTVPTNLGACTGIAAGGFENWGHTVAIQTNGTVKAWGWNGDGQIVVPLDLGPCTQVAAGGNHTAALQVGGKVRAWGSNYYGQTNVPQTLGPCLRITAGYEHTVAIQATPTRVHATDGEFLNRVDVTWFPMDGATGYQVWRAIGTGAATQIATVGTVLTYSDMTAIAGTLYSYSVKAIGSFGVSAASATDTGWRNIAAPTNVTAEDGSSLLHVLVRWDTSVGATGYKIFRDASPLSINNVSVNSYYDFTALPGTSYVYTVMAVTNSGVSLASTGDIGYRNLTPPTNIQASDGTSMSEVTVTWAASTGATEYQVWRAIGAGVAAQIATVGAVLTYFDTTAVPGTVYTYTVKAKGAVGLSVASEGNTGYRGLGPPLSVAATDGTLTTGVTVIWSGYSGATGYQVWRAPSAGAAAQIGTVGAVLTYSDTTAVPGILYTYSVKAITAAGTTPFGPSDTGYRNLTAPLSVAATDGTLTTGVTVTWAASTGATGYKIYRDGSEPALVTVGAVLTYSDTSAVPGISYAYTVRAITAAALSAASLSNTGYRNLTAPLSVAATDGTSTSEVTVTWAASIGATGYQVWRAIGAGAAAQLGTVGAVLAYSDTTAIAGTSYTYTIKATGVVGVSVASLGNTGYRNLTAPLSVAATDGTLTTGVTVTWAASTGATGYQVWRAIGAGVAAQLGTVGAVLTYSDTTAIAGTSYTYTVKATGAVGVSVASASDTGYRNLTAPLSVAATDGTSTSEVTVTWAASTGATGYQVWRAIGAGVAAQITTVGAVLTFADTSAVPGTAYTYTVKATGAVGVSAASLGNTGYRNLTAPLSVAATDGTLTTGVTVTWAASTGATGYQVWRAIGVGAAAQLGTVGTVLTYSDTSAVPGALYAYSVKATGAFGVSVASASDTGYRQLSAPLTVAATDGTLTTGVTVTWTAASGATGYKIYRDGSESALATVGAVLTYTDTTAVPGVSYAYTVRAITTAGLSAASLSDTGYRNLTAPLSVAATDGTSTSEVTVTWAASTGATGYQVWRALGAGAAAQLGTVGAVVTYSDTTAIAGTLYTYTVKATGAVGVSAASLGNTGYRNLNAPLSVAATDGTSTANVIVTWAASSGATGYQVWRVIGDGVAAQIGTVGAVVTYSDATAVPGTLYAYSVKATTAAGATVASASDTGYRNLTAPLGVAATDGTLTTGVTVTWAASTGATGYQVWRAIGAGVAAQIGTVGAVLTYSDTTAIAGTSYTYTVKATGAVGVSAASLSDTGYRNLTAPLSVAATDGTSTSEVTVSWAASTGATGYQVWRALGAGVAAQLGTVGAVVTYSDTTAIAGTLYTYSVKATGAVGVSVASASDTGYRQLSAPLTVAATDGTLTTGVTVTWAASSGATGYKIYRDGSEPALATVGAVLTYSDTSAVPGVSYAYTVRAITVAGLSAASLSDTGYRNLTAPLSVAATDGTLTTGVTVTWAASTGATGYQVWRALGAGVAAQIGTVGVVLTYSDTTAIAGTSYTYTVKATGAVGVSAASLGDTGYRNLIAPLSVAATDGSSTANVTVTWAASSGATGYQVWRALGAGVAAQIGTVGAVLTYSDTTAIAGTLYTYTIKATGAVGVSVASASDTGYRNRAAPTNCVASDNDTAKVRITWSLAAAGTPAVTGYEVGRSTVGGTPVVLTSALSATTIVFDDMTAIAGTPYTYTVRAKYVLVGSSPATTVTTLPTSDTGIRPVGATGDDGGIAGGPESSTALPGGSGNKGDESENAAGFGDSQNAATDPAGDGTENPQGEVKPEVKPEAKPDECMTIALALADQIDALKNELKQSVKDESATAITQKLLDRMRMLMEPVRDGELAVCAMTRGDVTLDGVTDDDDLGAFLESWSAGDLIGADLNRDGRITATDMAIVLSAIDAASGNGNGNGNGNPKTE